MKKSAIMSTLITRWQPDEAVEGSGYWVVTSPLVEFSALKGLVLGAHRNPDEAKALFEDMLDDALEDYQQGLIGNRGGPGKPQKHKTGLHAEVASDVKLALSLAAKDYGLSQGEMIEFLWMFHKAAQSS